MMINSNMSVLKIIKRKIISRTIRSIPKYIKSSIENDLSRNRCTVMSNETCQMLHIPKNKVSKDPLQKQSSGGVL